MTSRVLNKARLFRTVRLGRVTATIGFLLLSLTGCGVSLFGAADQPQPAVQKKAATPVLSLPRYTQGSWFAFDDGSRNEVVMVADENVIWENEKGKWEMRYRNPALPRLRWSRGSAIILADPTSLWPLQPGKTARFNVLRETRRKNGEVAKGKRIWDCEVDEPTGIKTEAGLFDAYPIICERRSRGRSDKLLRTRTFYYAPAIGHYVQFSTIDRHGVAKSRKLVSYHIETPTKAQ